jgi:UDP-glucose 4-epimerase
MNLQDPDLINSLSNISPSHVIHLAAQTDVRDSMLEPDSDLESNGFGTLNLVRSVIELGCMDFTNINSGGAIYSALESIPYTEDSKVKPDSAYGATKQLAEEYVRIFCENAGINWKSLALSNVYGSIRENKKGIFFEAWRSISEGSAFTIYGDHVTRDYIHVSDVVAAILSSLASDQSGRFNIGTGKETSNLQAFTLIRTAMEADTPFSIRDPRAGEVLRSALDITKAREKLGWTPEVDLISGVQEILL